MVRNAEGKKETFINIDIKDGLQGYSFSRASWKTKNGELFFGGDNGINYFTPGRTNLTKPKIVLTDFRISDVSIFNDIENFPLEKELNSSDGLELNYSQNNIAFQFSPIHYSRPERNLIAYKLEGFNKDWVYSKLHFASFTNLEPGEYIFKLKAANGDGLWSDEEKSIRIEIMPPYWRTNFAYIFYVFLFVGIIFGVDRYQRKRLLSKAREKARIKESEMRTKIAEAENKRKTKELEEARQLQLSMLPKELPQLAHLDIAVYMKTATEVGGDYYDFHIGTDGTLTVVLGDATGHGMKAGTMVTAVKSLFNSYASNKNILFTFQEMGRCIKQMHFQNLSMCMIMLKIQKDKISMSSAGMPPVYIYRKNSDSVHEYLFEGMPLGTMRNFPYKIKECNLNSGDVILLLSDGLPELKNNLDVQFGYRKVKNTLLEISDLEPDAIISKLKDAGSEWVNDNDPDDDVTFVVIKVK
jgi:serine phosphatase RsbU (regulator of sigma subunit)